MGFSATIEADNNGMMIERERTKKPRSDLRGFGCDRPRLPQPAGTWVVERESSNEEPSRTAISSVTDGSSRQHDVEHMLLSSTTVGA